MLIIPVKKTDLPIQIGEHKFFIDTSEKGADKFYKLVEEYSEKSHKIIEKYEKGLIKPETADKQSKKEIERVIDKLLGAGAFDKLFELSPDYAFISEYYIEICHAVSQEIKLRKYKTVKKMIEYTKPAADE